MMQSITPEQIDDILPQTQCGLCGYGGCMPYAEALVFENAPIHLCPPGGVKTLQALGELLNQDPEPYIAEMQAKAKPPLLAMIREAECIGCTKCIQACPVDAILGSAKQMHTVITDECTGCELCIPPCPVDCIEMLPQPEVDETQRNKSHHARERFHARRERLSHQQSTPSISHQNSLLNNKKKYIEEAIARAKAKKSLVIKK